MVAVVHSYGLQHTASTAHGQPWPTTATAQGSHGLRHTAATARDSGQLLTHGSHTL